jgi:hypothetical protein
MIGKNALPEFRGTCWTGFQQLIHFATMQGKVALFEISNLNFEVRTQFAFPATFSGYQGFT